MKLHLQELIKAQLLIALYLAPFILISAFIMKKWGENNLKDELEYEKQYKQITSQIENNIVCENRRIYLAAQIQKLRDLPYKNIEKTDVLNNKFLIKYASLKQNSIVEPILK